MNITTLDQQINIAIPPPSKKIGILLSGGMDSALLLFLLLKEIELSKSDVELIAYNVPNVNDNARYHSSQVVDYLEKHFNKKINYQSIGDGTLPPRQLINTPADYIIKNQLVDVLYSAQNQFPPDAQAWPAYIKAQGSFKRRDPSLPDPVHSRFPFIRLYKHHILEIYRQYNILDLAYITHSCTARTEGKCGECLWCVERAWAFDKLSLSDLG